LLATPVGNYQPLPYLLPGALMRAAGAPPGALRLARLAAAMTALALLSVAAFALYDARAPTLSISGLLLAVTPMALYCASILNGSGLEIAASVTFVACLLRLSRDGGSGGRWRLAAAASGAVFALSRPASPLWLVLVGVVTMLWGATTWRSLRRAAARYLWPAAAVALAVTINLVWEARYGSHVGLDTSALHAGIVAGAHEWWRAVAELIGRFGYLNVKLPLVLPVAWLGAIGVLALIAARRSRRDRLLLAGLVGAFVVLPPVFYAVITRPTGFGLQGRQLLPVFVILPLLAGETAYRAGEVLGARVRRLAVWVPAAAGWGQVAAWYVNAKHSALGNSSTVWFTGRAQWSPPGGWALWCVVVAGAGVASTLLSLTARRAEPLLKSVA
jgi:Predicted membrane protein (DUF2142)